MISGSVVTPRNFPSAPIPIPPMKNPRLPLAFSALGLFATACSPDDSATAPQVDPVDAFGFTSVEEAREHLGDYADVFVAADAGLTLRATQYDAFEDDLTDYYLRGYYRDPVTGRLGDGGDYHIGAFGLVYSQEAGDYIRVSQLADDRHETDLAPLFGEVREVVVERPRGTTLVSTPLHVPRKLDAKIAGLGQVEGSTATAIARNGTTVSFEADDANEHGVVAYTLWSGSQLGVSAQEIDPTTRVQRAVLLPDEGSATLPQSLFEGMPEGAVVSLWMIRGDVELVEANDLLFSFTSIDETKFVLALTD